MLRFSSVELRNKSSASTALRASFIASGIKQSKHLRMTLLFVSLALLESPVLLQLCCVLRQTLLLQQTSFAAYGRQDLDTFQDTSPTLFVRMYSCTSKPVSAAHICCPDDNCYGPFMALSFFSNENEENLRKRVEAKWFPGGASYPSHTSGRSMPSSGPR